MERIPSLELSVSATTRSPRPGERDGVDYHFLSHDEFDRRVAAGEFVEDALEQLTAIVRAELERSSGCGRLAWTAPRGEGRAGASAAKMQGQPGKAASP